MNFQEKINRLQGLMSGDIPLSQNVVTLEMHKKQALDQIFAFFEVNDRGLYGSFDGRLSFSFLKHVDNVRNPKFQHPNNNKERNFALGRAFEDMLCEPDKFNPNKYSELGIADFENTEKMCAYAKADVWVNEYLGGSYELQKELVGTIKGYQFKGKCDFYNKEAGIIADVKTTSAKSLLAFKKASVAFAYFTQGVVYCELGKLAISPDKDTYIISAVCKSFPAVFHVSMSKQDFELGDKELDRLIGNVEYYGISNLFKA